MGERSGSSERRNEAFVQMENFAWTVMGREGRNAMPGQGAPHGRVGYPTGPVVPPMPGVPMMPWQRPGLLGYLLGGMPLFEFPMPEIETDIPAAPYIEPVVERKEAGGEPEGKKRKTVIGGMARQEQRTCSSGARKPTS